MRIFENEYDRIEISEDVIPTWAKWLAVDEDGEVWVYEYAPKSEVQDDTGMWFEDSEEGKCSYTGIKASVINWELAKWKI